MFREIEVTIAPDVGASTVDFRTEIHRSVSSHRLEAREARDLDEMYTLRNSLTHFGIDGQDPFEVSAVTVRRMERIRNELTKKAPTVRGLLGDVLTATPDMSMGKASHLMAEHDYSCLPINDGARYCGTLDADVLMHRVGEQLTSMELLEDCTVAEVRGMYPDPPVEFCRADALQRDVVCMFERAMLDEVPLAAVIATTDGRREGKLRGIFTAWDVPSLLK